MLNPKCLSLKALFWLSVSMSVVLLDQLSKFTVLRLMAFQKPLKIFSFFNLYLDFNHGAAFNFLSHESGWQVWFLSGVAAVICLGIVSYFIVASAASSMRLGGLALILGGALGNLIDRVRMGHVIDFISLHAGPYYWPTFNIADSAVCVGVVILFFNLNVKKDAK